MFVNVVMLFYLFQRYLLKNCYDIIKKTREFFYRHLK